MSSQIARKWPWFFPLVFVVAALFTSQLLSLWSNPAAVTRFLTIVQALGCGAFAGLGIYRLVDRWHLYRRALDDGNHVSATNFELLIGFVMLCIGEAAHNIITVSATLHKMTMETWPHFAAGPARALEVAGILFCVRAICIRQFNSEAQWLWITAGLLAVGKLFTRHA